jgi:hypothetical protein
MPKNPVVDLPPEEHAQMLAALRRTRDGDRLALPILLWWAAGCGSAPHWWPKTTLPAASSAWPACARSSSTSNCVRPWSSLTNWLSTCGPTSAVPGCPQGLSSRS